MRSLVFLSVLLFLLCSSSAIAQQASVFPGLTGSVLRDSLVNKYKTQTVLDYNNSRDSLFGFIFLRDSLIECIYTGDTIRINLSDTTPPRTQADIKGFNTEHSYPQSKGATSGNANSDLYHLFPVRGDVNSSRSNLPFMDIPDNDVSRWWRSNYSQTNTPDTLIEEYSKRASYGFEVRDAKKGDIARAVFYFYTMYRSEADNADPFFFNTQLRFIRRWHFFDRPDTTEYLRNERTAPLQNAKLNPFIIDTTLVRRAFGIDPPQNFTLTILGETQVKLNWQKNMNSDDVIIVRNQSGVFFDPKDGMAYPNGFNIDLNGYIINTSGDSLVDLLPFMGTYYYRIYSNNFNNYSVSLFRSVTTGFTGALHYWNFNHNAPEAQEIWDTIIPAFSGSGILIHNMPDVKAFQGSILNTMPNDEAGSSFAPRGINNNNRHLILHMPTINKKDIVFSYVARGTTTGYNTHNIFYSSDGVHFDSLISFQNTDYDWTVRQIDFSGITAVNDNPEFSIKIVISGATHSLGNNRFDNFKLIGNDLDFSIYDDFHNSKITVFPNPFSDEIFISTDKEIESPHVVNIYNINGALLHTETCRLPAYIKAEHLLKGYYIIRITSDNDSATAKLIKL